MNCENCGKLLELSEKEFCTGCGEKIDWVAAKARERHKKNKNSFGPLPYGVRVVASGVEMDARIKGMVLSVFITSLFILYLAKFIFLLNVSTTIGIIVIGAIFSVLISLFITARLPDKAKVQLADAFSFIPTEGFLHFIVDVLFTRIPFLEPGGKKNPRQ